MDHTVNKFKSYEIREYQILDSTNLHAKRLLDDGLQDNVVIVANSQTAGRGRGNRVWVSDEGNLFFTIVIDAKKINPPEIASYIAAISVSNAIKNLGPTPVVKWPNDVLIEEKKVCGILVESYKKALVIGIGVNVNSCPEYLEGNRKACALKSFVSDIDTEKFLQMILSGFDYEVEAYGKNGFTPLRQKIIENLYRFNEDVELDYLGEKISGRIIDISPCGDIVIETEEGNKEYRTGEIFDL